MVAWWVRPLSAALANVELHESLSVAAYRSLAIQQLVDMVLMDKI